MTKISRKNSFILSLIILLSLTVNSIPYHIEDSDYDSSQINNKKTLNFSWEHVWTYGGMEICQMDEYQWRSQICRNNDGSAILVWEDERDDEGDIYAQRVNQHGTILWTLNGKAICKASDEQEVPQIINDGQNGAFIAWSDNRDELGSWEHDIYAQRINSEGNPIWKTNGIIVCNATNAQENVQIISDGLGGLIIIWEDHRPDPNEKIYAQHINSTGHIKWGNNGTAICTQYMVAYRPQLCTDQSGGAIIAWDGGGIRAQRINSTGDVIWTGINPLYNAVSICTGVGGHQEAAQIVSDGAGGALLTWWDTRNGNEDIYAQKIDADGNTIWDDNGTAVCTATGVQIQPEICNDGAGGAIITWWDLRNGTGDIYAQRIDVDGNTMWDDNGTVVCSAINDQSSPKLCGDDAGGALIIWRDTRSGPNGVMYAQRIDNQGIIKWTVNGIIVGSTKNIDFNLCSDGKGGFMSVWSDYDIHTQHIKNSQPTSNHPLDIKTSQTASDTIDWILSDDCGGGKYRIWQNYSNGMNYLWIDWDDWSNNEIIKTPINRTKLETCIYTIEYYDDQNLFGLSDLVVVEVFSANEKSIEGYNLIILIGILSIVSILIRKKLRD